MSLNLVGRKDYIISISLGGFLATIPILLGILYITRNALIPMTYDELGFSMILCAVFFLLPEYFNKNKLLAFLSLCVILPVFGMFFFKTPLVLEILLVILFLITVYFTAKSWKSLSFQFIVLSFLVSLFFILVVYSSSAQILSPVYNEIIINGKAVPDTLFHSSLSTSIVMEKTVSTRIFSSSAFPYHWFSHFLYGGLAKFTHLNNISFYNWLYPALIVPIFIKYLFILYQEIFKHFKYINEKYLLILFPTLLLYVFVVIGVPGFPSYLSSESLIFAHILQFIIWTLILRYKSEVLKNRIIFLLIFAILTLLLFTKVSVGVLTFIPLVYIGVRMARTKFDYILLFLCTLVFGSICIFYFLNIRVESEKVNFVTRLLNFNGNVISFFSYLVSIIFIVSYFISNKNSLEKIKSDFKNKKNILEELIIISIISSFILGIYFGNRKDDSFYFASTYFFINFILLILFIIQNFKISLSKNRVKIIGLFTIIFSFLMCPQFFMIKHNSYNEKREALQKDERMTHFLKILAKENFSEDTILSISRNEKWFWDSQLNKITPYFIIAGISNAPALLEILNDDLSSNHYSFPAYKKIYEDISSEAKLLAKAQSMGYTNLVYIYSLNNHLVIKKIKLK